MRLACDNGRMPQLTPGHGLQARAADGVHVAVRLTRRTVGYARPAGATPLERVAAPVLLIPVVLVMLAFAAALLLATLVFALLFAVSVALSALSDREHY